MAIPILLLILVCGTIAGGILALVRIRSALRWVAVSGAAAAAMFFGLLATLAFGLAYSHPESGVALASVEWLDSRASDISFYRANDFSGNFAYEFRIGGDDFATLARERGWQVGPLTEHRNVMRYTFFLPETDSRRQKPFSVEFDSGLFYESRRPNGGGITVLYDTNASRAYVSQSSR
jgi:hypothetical protein